MLKRILIAEDDEQTRELLTALAREHGYEVVAVIDGIELLTIAETEKFDVIITDLMMKNLNGVSATEIMKMQGNATPVIALTGINPKDMGLLLNSFTKIYQKPYDVGELFEYIDSLIENRLGVDL